MRRLLAIGTLVAGLFTLSSTGCGFLVPRSSGPNDEQDSTLEEKNCDDRGAERCKDGVAHICVCKAEIEEDGEVPRRGSEPDLDTACAVPLWVAVVDCHDSTYDRCGCDRSIGDPLYDAYCTLDNPQDDEPSRSSCGTELDSQRR